MPLMPLTAVRRKRLKKCTWIARTCSRCGAHIPTWSQDDPSYYWTVRDETGQMIAVLCYECGRKESKHGTTDSRL